MNEGIKMKYTLFVEGEYDKILFERQIKPLFEDLGHKVEFFEWAQSPDRVTCRVPEFLS